MTRYPVRLLQSSPGVISCLFLLLSSAQKPEKYEKRKTACRVLLSALVLCGVVVAQVAPGLPNFSAFDSHDLDTVNLMNNNIVLSIPLSQKNGALPFGSALVANSNVYVLLTGKWYPSMELNFRPSVRDFSMADAFAYAGTRTSYTCNGGSTTKNSNWYVQTALGTTHWLPASDYTTDASGPGCNPTFTDITTDDSGFTITASGYRASALYTRSGISFATGVDSLTDANGNTIAFNTTNNQYTDSMGLIALTGAPGSSYTWSNTSGTSTVTPSTSSLSVQTAFGCSGITDISPSSAAMPSYVSLADGTSLGITYEGTPGHLGNYTGRIETLTLREGGTVKYTYGGGANGIDCSYLNVPALTRTLGNGDTTTYTLTHSLISGSNYKATNTVLDPGGNKTVYTFTGFTSSGSSSTFAQVLTQVQRFQGSTLLTTDVYCYNTVFSSCSFTGAATASVTLPITKQVNMHQINGMSTTSATEAHFDAYGNVTYLAAYGFGGTAPTQTTTTTYGTWNGSVCIAIGNNVSDRPCDVLTAQGGNSIAESHFTYDSHGNLLKTSLWNGSSWIGQTTANSYNSNGTPSATYDVANDSTTYLYEGPKYMHCSSCTQYPFPTSISNAALTVSSTWDGYGGVRLTDIDANLNTTTYGYDVYNRIISINDPMGNSVSNTYPVGSAPDYMQNDFTFNSGKSGQFTTTEIDGYGRTINVQTAQSSGSNYDTSSMAFGWSGNYRTAASSEPCSAAITGTCPTVHTNYLDPLGRLYQETTTYNEQLTHTYAQNDDLSVLSFPPSGEKSKQMQTQYDGLGRPTSICAISSIVSGNVLCNQNTNTAATGVLTTISYTSATGSQTVSSARGSQTRSTTHDGLGRVTQTMTPEGGTTIYVFDTGGGCGTTYPGKLVALAQARNGTCYYYDSIGRLSAAKAFITWPGFTACRWFYYDNSTGYSGTIPIGITISNGMGRMVEAATDNCSGTTLLTDEWFSYDKNGHMTDMWELTPHSGTYYHSHAIFAGNGAPLTVQLANPSLYTETYGLDGEGRLATLSSGGTTIVAGTTYNAASQPTYIDLGTGTDQSDYSYDPNTGRMKYWTFQVGNASENGTLTWNANGTLRQLAIVDGFNSSGSQTCNFGTSTVMGYDDLGRLLSDDCGSVWQQTFSYQDQYDNLTKAGSSAWNPGYNSGNNHYSIGSYDANGNVTSDSNHTYSWDEYSKLHSIDSSSCASNGECATYDALGRIVETSYNGVYTEIWYTPLGKTVYMHGSTPQYAYWPTPGNGTVEVNGNNSTFYYMHKDWLGNSRISSVISTSQVISDQAYAPYGEVYNKQATGASTPAQMFTGDTQDIIGGIFDTPNRELNAGEGRWLSPDPAHSGWNQYAYTTNPNTFIDPSGLVCSAAVGPAQQGDTTCNGYNYGGGGGSGSFAGYSVFDIATAAYSGSYEVRDPTAPSIMIGDDNGSLIIGGCDGCTNTEIPQLMTVYPHIGLLSLLAFTSSGTVLANNTANNNIQTNPFRQPTKTSRYLVTGTQCSAGCHPEPFTPHGSQDLCKNAAILGVGIGLAAGPWVEGPLAWAAYFGGNALGIYGLLNCS